MKKKPTSTMAITNGQWEAIIMWDYIINILYNIQYNIQYTLYIYTYNRIHLIYLSYTLKSFFDIGVGN